MKQWKRSRFNRLAREAEERGENELAASFRDAVERDLDVTVSDITRGTDATVPGIVSVPLEGETEQSSAEVISEPSPAPVVKKWKQYRTNKLARESDATRASEAQKAADLILSLLEAFGTTFAGPEAAISPMERVLFDSSLPQMIRDMESETFKRVQQIAMPGICLVGFAAYSMRVYNLYTAQHPPDEPGNKKPPQEPQPPVAPITMDQPANGREVDLTTPHDFREEMQYGNREV